MEDFLYQPREFLPGSLWTPCHSADVCLISSQDEEDDTMTEPKDFMEKNIEMWERWTSTYTDTMLKAMEKTMEQSAAFRKQVDKAVSTAVSAQLEATLTAIKALERQVETLAGKVDELLEED
jgi:hypothetical protein